MSSYRNLMEAKQRSADRRQREDASARLSAEMPRLATLHFEIENGDNRYVWRIMVERAPALFNIACGEPSCREGGHDLTMNVMRALRMSQTRFEGEDTCQGATRGIPCNRVLRYVGVATYCD